MRMSIRTTSGSQLGDSASGFLAVLRLSDDLHVRLSIEDHAEAPAHESLVVCDEDANHSRLPPVGSDVDRAGSVGRGDRVSIVPPCSRIRSVSERRGGADSGRCRHAAVVRDRDLERVRLPAQGHAAS